MRNDRLQELLARADAAKLPEMSGDLAHRVRVAAKRRARVRRIGAGVGTAASLGVCVAIVAMILHSKDAKTTATPLTQARVAEIRAELASLDSEVSLHQKTAEILVRRQMRGSRNQADTRAAQPDVPQRVDDARERAALMLVREARRTVAQGGSDAAANDDYERAARLFPETAAGREAAQHVKRT